MRLFGILENPSRHIGKTIFVPDGPRGGGKGEVNLLPLAKRREKREELEIKHAVGPLARRIFHLTRDVTSYIIPGFIAMPNRH